MERRKGKLIGALIEKFGTRVDAAQRLGISYNKLSGICSGRVSASTVEIQKICRGLSMTANDLSLKAPLKKGVRHE